MSGEEIAISFFRELKGKYSDIHFWGVGGDQLKSQGMETIFHIKDFSSMGISEVLFKIVFYIKALFQLLGMLKDRKTSSVVLIDFQEFNRVLAFFIKLGEKLSLLQEIKVIKVVAPTAWVWREGRVKGLRNNIDRLFTILPFEKKWFNERGVENIIEAPHPLALKYSTELETIKSKQAKSEPQVLLVLPGSRRDEISRMLPLFTRAAVELKKEHNLKLAIVRVNHVDSAYYDDYIDNFEYSFTNENIEEALKLSDCAFVCSGTVTLLCGLWDIPSIVCYRGSHLNEFFYNTLVRYSGPISMNNLVHQERVFPEFIQEEATIYNIKKASKEIFFNPIKYQKVKLKLIETYDLLAGKKATLAEGLVQEFAGVKN